MKHRSTGCKSTGRAVVDLFSDDRSVCSLSLDVALILLKVGRHATLAEDENLSLVPGRLCVLSCDDVQDEETKEKAKKDTDVSVSTQYMSYERKGDAYRHLLEL